MLEDSIRRGVTVVAIIAGVLAPAACGEPQEADSSAWPADVPIASLGGAGDTPAASSGGATPIGGTGGSVGTGVGGTGAVSGGTGGASGTGVSLDAGAPITDAAVDAAADAGAEPGEPWKFVGNITTLGQVRSDFITYWDQITPENEGKWGSVEGTRDVMSWSGLDAAYDYAKAQGIPFKQHTFVWGSQQPGWIGGLPQAEQRAEVEEWIKLYCERYPDTHMIDVVNEPPPHTTPPYAQALGGAGASGWDWIVQAFEWADQYCPDAILILNDYNTIEYGGDNAHIIDIVKAIQAAGAPIDAVGVQAHAAHDIPTATVETFLNEIADETGLPIYVSEYDIDEGDDITQRNIMEEQFTMFWENEHVKGITLWGYVEGQTWLTNSGLMSPAGAKRPAMEWLMTYLGR